MNFPLKRDTLCPVCGHKSLVRVYEVDNITLNLKEHLSTGEELYSVEEGLYYNECCECGTISGDEECLFFNKLIFLFAKQRWEAERKEC